MTTRRRSSRSRSATSKSPSRRSRSPASTRSRSRRDKSPVSTKNDVDAPNDGNRKGVDGGAKKKWEKMATRSFFALLMAGGFAVLAVYSIAWAVGAFAPLLALDPADGVLILVGVAIFRACPWEVAAGLLPISVLLAPGSQVPAQLSAAAGALGTAAVDFSVSRLGEVVYGSLAATASATASIAAWTASAAAWTATTLAAVVAWSFQNYGNPKTFVRA